jgi:hypothetical protein
MKSSNHTSQAKMARHRSHFLYILFGLIPPVLLTISWALSIKATISGNWAMRENYSADVPPVDMGPLHRSPFTSCGSVFGNRTVNGSVVMMWYESCTRYAKPGASCNATAIGFDYPALCQQINLASKLLVVDCVFGGLAFTLGWGLCVWGVFVHRPEEDHDHNGRSEGRVVDACPFRYDPATPLYVFAVTAAIAAFLAAMIGGNALVNLSPPTGDFSSGTVAETKDAGWSFDEGYVYASASWIWAAFGAWSVSWVWGRGRGVGRGE